MRPKAYCSKLVLSHTFSTRSHICLFCFCFCFLIFSYNIFWSYSFSSTPPRYLLTHPTSYSFIKNKHTHIPKESVLCWPIIPVPGACFGCGWYTKCHSIDENLPFPDNCQLQILSWLSYFWFLWKSFLKSVFQIFISRFCCFKDRWGSCHVTAVPGLCNTGDWN